MNKSKSKPVLYSPEWFRKAYTVKPGQPSNKREQRWGLDWRDLH